MTRLLSALLLGAGLTALAAPALAQQGDDRRVQRLEQQVRELRSIVFQGRDTGQPVEVKPVGPDPQVVALEAKVDELQQQIRAQTGQMEVLGHDLDEARRTAEQLKADSAGRRQAVDDRLGRLEAQSAAAAPPPPAATDPLPPPPEPTAAARRPARGDATTRAQTGDTSRFGDPRPAPATAAAADPFADAYQRLTDADYSGAQAGFEGYIAGNPTGARAPEARYYLGQSLSGLDDYAGAARAYAGALKGWPKTKWAPDAIVRLAQSLAATKSSQTCAALGEFDRRYAATASAAVKGRAAAIRGKAACPAG